MPVIASFGHSQALDGADAASRAAYLALRGLSNNQPGLGIVIATRPYALGQVAAGAAQALGDTPLFGFSTSALLTSRGLVERGVAVALLAGSQLDVRAGWWPGFSNDASACTSAMLQALQPGAQPKAGLLLAAEGLNGEPAGMCNALPKALELAGCLAGGDLHAGRTYQLGGAQAGNSGLAAALLQGCRISSAAGHGWSEVGAYARVTKSRGLWLRGLDGHPAAQTYAHLFGYPLREWSFPPLNQLVRQYPLHVQTPNDGPPILRAPLRVEADGGLRMSTSIPQESMVHIMLGSTTACLDAARQAARQALAALDGIRPVLALLFVDTAWQTLLQSHPGAEIAAVQDTLGSEVTLLGGYTYGQIAPGPALLNAHLQVVLLG